MHPELDQLTTSDLDNLAKIDLNILRSKRSACAAAETDISFVRRLTQGRLDIVGHEAQRRNGTTGRGDLNEVLYEMPSILSDGPTGSKSGGRAPRIDGPSASALEILERLDAVVSAPQLSDLGGLNDEALAALISQLQEFEGELSTSRRVLHETIDSIQGEIVRRYRDGEASVDTLLQ